MSRMFAVIDSISWRMWLETMTLLPARPQSLIMRMVLRRAIGSMPDERLVENEQLRIVGERLGHLDALAHALAVGADLLVRGVGQLDHLERAGAPARAPRRRSTPFKPDQRRHPLEPGHAVVERVLLGAEADAEVERRVLPDRLAEDA